MSRAFVKEMDEGAGDDVKRYPSVKQVCSLLPVS